jgi:DNA-binding FadR family transcriptional regulator
MGRDYLEHASKRKRRFFLEAPVATVYNQARMRTPLTAFRLDDEHKELLEACASKERLPKSEALRRAIRAYADMLGVAKDETVRPRKLQR